jgi:hypothetical protein
MSENLELEEDRQSSENLELEEDRQSSENLELEEDRQSELKDLGLLYKDLEAQFGIGTYGEHEAIDRLSVLNMMWDNTISEHPAIIIDKSRYYKAQEISRKIFELYEEAAQASLKNSKDNSK